ncbi:hypothetical protein PLICRDRAFT_89080 [Plicaturopsis crispa FD-325 SS-3]|nr:hypothetical protein PLICRDRAFT_89080 [Plicaturopsis crispa FD-325 SS-3]
MAMKRKFVESEDASPHTVKHQKLVPFPQYEPDVDVAMSDVEPPSDQTFHIRIPSNTSSNSSDIDIDSPVYPSFDLYPLTFKPEGASDSNPLRYHDLSGPSTPPSPSVGLIQPSSNFSHHGTSCSQIPKLKVACAPGLNGQRTMWSFCEQCGSISMVESD